MFGMHVDCRARGRWEVLDRGLFVLYGWPVVLPDYLVTTRGPRGLLQLLGLVAVFGVSYLASLPLFFPTSESGKMIGGPKTSLSGLALRAVALADELKTVSRRK
jgi:hypothetical protein